MTSDPRRQRAAIALYAFAGGFADASSYLLFRTFTGHVTGNLVLLVISLAGLRWAEAATRFVAISCFLLCTAIGFRVAGWRRRNWWLLLLQAGCLAPDLLLHRTFGVWRWVELAGFPCALGLQNGVVMSSLGVHVHSTFVSGDFTSLLKAETAQRSGPGKDGAAAARRWIFALVVLGFTAGALCAALAGVEGSRWLPAMLLVPLGLAATVAGQVDQDA